MGLIDVEVGWAVDEELRTEWQGLVDRTCF
jgi:hypothetical protein